MIYLPAAVLLLVLSYQTIILYAGLIRLFWAIHREVPREANQEQHTASKGSRSRSDASDGRG